MQQSNCFSGPEKTLILSARQKCVSKQLRFFFFFFFFGFDSLRPINNLSVKQGRFFLG